MKAKLQKLRTDERAVSPVVGVALLIAIAVILAAIIAAVVLGLGVGPTETPQATLSFETEENGDYNVILIHDGGDALDADNVVVVHDHDAATDRDDLPADMIAGDSEEIVTDADEGDVIRIVWEDPESDQTMTLEEFTV